MNQATKSTQAITNLTRTWDSPRSPRTRCRIGIPNTGKLRSLIAPVLATIYPIDHSSANLLTVIDGRTELVCARSNDLPYLLGSGHVDLIITGSDYCFESGHDLAQLVDLGLIRGKICMLSPCDNYSAVITPRVISTQYPRHATLLASTLGAGVEVRTVSGAGEIYPQIGLSDATVDCVVTGRTCRENQMEIRHVIRDVTTGIYVRACDKTNNILTQMALELMKAFNLSVSSPCALSPIQDSQSIQAPPDRDLHSKF